MANMYLVTIPRQCVDKEQECALVIGPVINYIDRWLSVVLADNAKQLRRPPAKHGSRICRGSLYYRATLIMSSGRGLEWLYFIPLGACLLRDEIRISST